MHQLTCGYASPHRLGRPEVWVSTCSTLMDAEAIGGPTPCCTTADSGRSRSRSSSPGSASCNAGCYGFAEGGHIEDGGIDHRVGRAMRGHAERTGRHLSVHDGGQGCARNGGGGNERGQGWGEDSCVALPVFGLSPLPTRIQFRKIGRSAAAVISSQIEMSIGVLVSGRNNPLERQINAYSFMAECPIQLRPIVETGKHEHSMISSNNTLNQIV